MTRADKYTLYWNSAAVICPQVKCSCNCEDSGFKRNREGCQTCLCNDPCEVNQHYPPAKHPKISLNIKAELSIDCSVSL